MPASFTLSAKDQAIIKTLYEIDRVFATEIARELGLRYTLVKRVLRQQGIKSRGMYTSPAFGTEFNEGQLKVIRLAAPATGKNGRLEIRVWVRCRCNGPNSEFVVAVYKLRSRSIKSCGCLWLASPNYRPHRNREWDRVLRLYRNNNRGFALCVEQIKIICTLPCFYCGLPPSNELMGRHKRVSTGKVVLLYSGIDQVVHGKGHELGNVLPACIICNRSKSDSRLEEWCRYIRIEPSKVIQAAKRLGQRLKAVPDAQE